MERDGDQWSYIIWGSNERREKIYWEGVRGMAIEVV